MSHREADYRKYEKMTRNGIRSMNNNEIVEEAKDTLKLGKRKAISGKDTLETFNNSDKTDMSLCREGFIDLQIGLELLLKGLIEYYGESYKEEHYTDNNGEILENLTRQFPELNDLHDAFGILQDDDFSFTMYKCSKFPKYKSFYTNQNFKSCAYKLVDLLVKYINDYILVD